MAHSQLVVEKYGACSFEWTRSVLTMRQPLILRSLFAMAAAAALLSVSAYAQTSGDTGSFAIIDVRVEIGDGRSIDKATILVKDGLIKAVGPDIKAPPDAIVIKGTGLVAYPGFIDAGYPRGLKLPEWQPDQDKAPDTTSLAPATMREANRKWVRPELRARDCLALTDTDLDPMRRNGFCAALLSPSEGLMSGISTVALLSGAPKRDCVVRGVFGEHFSFSPGVAAAGSGPRAAGAGGTNYPGSLMGIIAHLRQTLIDGSRQKAWKAKSDRGEASHAPADDTLESLAAVLDGTMPVVFSADSRNEIHRALTLADEFHLKLILSGGGEAWKETKALASRNIPVLASLNFGDEPGVTRQGGPGGGQVPGGGGRRRPGGRPGEPPAAVPGTVPPVPNDAPAQDDPGTPRPAGQPPAGQPVVGQAPAGQPGATRAASTEPDDTPKAVIAERHMKWEERASCPAKLEQAKIPFAFTSAGLRNPTDFWGNLRHAIKNGLTKQAALKALTADAARILGVDRELGTIEVGKMASIVLMSAEFTDPTSKVKYLIIDRNKFEPDVDQRPTPIVAAPTPMDDDDDGGKE
jgi:imidazolonepropionase-like amidohydrolase